MPAVISVLYPKLFNKKGAKSKLTLDLNRGIIFGFFASLSTIEIKYLLDLLLQNYNFP